jgi:sterol desaturase/sphingolipid hydroxylase (fatty acid hydroxylase superfamily)
MYWLAGIRTSIPHIILFNFTFVAATPLLANVPAWVFQFIAIEHIFRNNWMHMNVAWKSSLLEWLIVTPRYHHIHHSSDSQHYSTNLASLLTVLGQAVRNLLQPGKAGQGAYLRS